MSTLGVALPSHIVRNSLCTNVKSTVPAAEPFKQGSIKELAATDAFAKEEAIDAYIAQLTRQKTHTEPAVANKAKAVRVDDMKTLREYLLNAPALKSDKQVVRHLLAVFKQTTGNPKAKISDLIRDTANKIGINARQFTTAQLVEVHKLKQPVKL